jgi:hypothetical protein
VNRAVKWWLVIAVCAALTGAAVGGWFVWNGRESAALRGAVAGATSLRVRTGGGCHFNPDQVQTIFEVRDQTEIRRIVGKLRIKGDDRPGPPCMCCGWPTIEFYRDKELIGALSCHHGKSLRWHGAAAVWRGDAGLSPSGARFLNSWLTANGAVRSRWESRPAPADK